MKALITLIVVTGLVTVSCKKESQARSSGSDTITTPDTETSIPVPAKIDTLVAAPKSDTASTKQDSEAMRN
jgi:hypothetical protein